LHLALDLVVNEFGLLCQIWLIVQEIYCLEDVR